MNCDAGLAGASSVQHTVMHARGAHDHLDANLDRWARWFAEGAISESTVRAFVEDTALALQAGALRDGPKEVLDGFCAIRLPSEGRSLAYGAFTANIAAERLIERAMPKQ